MGAAKCVETRTQRGVQSGIRVHHNAKNHDDKRVRLNKYILFIYFVPSLPRYYLFRPKQQINRDLSLAYSCHGLR